MSRVVVIVEPDGELRSKLETMLSDSFQDIAITSFNSPKSAMIEICHGLVAELIITAYEPDIETRSFTGADLCRAVRGYFGRDAAPPCIVTVADDQPLTPAYQAGAADVLLKPFRDASLLAKVHVCLKQQAESEHTPEPRHLTTESLEKACRMGSITDSGGFVFGNYLIIDELGRGGIGVVAKAFRVDSGTPAALKLLQPDLVRDEEWFTRFRREGQVLMGIEHKHLVQNKAIGVNNNIYYIDMDFLVGTPLNRVIDQRKSLGEEEAFELICQLSMGLAELERNGVIHRDIKPENILVREDGHAFLIDFGLSKRAGDVQLTQEGEILGTVAFIAPETISGEEANIATDIYSLGVTLYEMLTGEDMFATHTTREIFLDTLRGNTVNRAARALSGKAAEILRKMMAVSRKDRYAQPEEVVADIRDAYPEAYAKAMAR